MNWRIVEQILKTRRGWEDAIPKRTPPKLLCKTAMPTLCYLGNDPQILKNLNLWLEDFTLHHPAIPAGFVLEELCDTDVVLLEWDFLPEAFPQALKEDSNQALLAQIPLILLVDFSLEERPEEVLQNPPFAWMQKPLQKFQLHQQVQHALQHRQNQLQLAQQTQHIHTLETKISTAQQEKETLLQEIHHRVKNNLQIVSSLLTFHSSEQSDPRLAEILKSTQSRVDTISLIHKKLYEGPDFSTIDLADCLEQQILNLFNHFSEKTQHITLDYAGDSVHLDIDRALPCALLVNELVVNALRHGFATLPLCGKSAGRLQVRLAVCEETRLHLTIADNGVGLPAHITPPQTSSTGLRLVHHLVSQLGGRLVLSRESGTAYRIEFALA